MTKALYLLILPVVLVGCISTSELTLPDGSPGYGIHCNELANLSQCYQKAGELCGAAGYQVFDAQRNREFSSDGTSNVTNDLIIGCNKIT